VAYFGIAASWIFACLHATYRQGGGLVLSSQSPRCLRMSRITDWSSMKLMIRMIPLHFGQTRGSTFPAFAGTDSYLLNQSCPAFPGCLHIFLRFEDAGNNIIIAVFFLPFPPCGVAVIIIVPDYLFAPVRDVHTNGGQPRRAQSLSMNPSCGPLESCFLRRLSYREPLCSCMFTISKIYANNSQTSAEKEKLC